MNRRKRHTGYGLYLMVGLMIVLLMLMTVSDDGDADLVVELKEVVIDSALALEVVIPAGNISDSEMTGIVQKKIANWLAVRDCYTLGDELDKESVLYSDGSTVKYYALSSK